MKQNPTIHAVLEEACHALMNITVNPANKVIAGAAGAVQVHVSASSYPTTKQTKKLPSQYYAPYHLTIVLYLYTSPPLPMVLYPLSS